MLRHLIAFAALACSALAASVASAAPPLEPAIVHAITSVDDAVTPAEVVAVAPLAQVDGPASTSTAAGSTSSLMAAEPASVASFGATAHRLHVDPGRGAVHQI